MGTKINVAGVWKEPTVKINVAGVWKSPSSVKINVAGVWKEVNTVPPTCSLSSTNVSHTDDISIVYAGVDYKSDGVEYSNASPNSSTCTNSRGAWLDTGSPSSVYGSCQINSGSLWTNEFPAYANRTVMTTDKMVMVRDTNSGVAQATANVTVRMYDAFTGGNLLGSGTFSLTAQYYNPCPLCCFTPDTPVLMGNGTYMPIGRVREGDEIIVYDSLDRKNKVEKVGEVIVRYDRAMYAVQFDDGTHLRVSDDHPFHIEEKGGPAAINPIYEYKGWGVPGQVHIGDLVTQPDGSRAAITAIKKIDYKGAVFTFSNSLFYANGKLVY